MIDDNDLLLHKLREDAIIPSKRKEDGWFDLYPCFEQGFTEIQPNKIKLIPTGIISAFSCTRCVEFGERGTNTKSHLALMAGKIDSGYRGEWFVALRNTYTKPVLISKQYEEFIEDEYYVYVPYKKAICQFAFREVLPTNVVECSEDEIKSFISERGDGKLGSSGK